MNGRPPRSTLFPSTPLFRSHYGEVRMSVALEPIHQPAPAVPRATVRPAPVATPILDVRAYSFWYGPTQALFDVTVAIPRSEEHTSELQSQSNLVCRLLLEKK